VNNARAGVPSHKINKPEQATGGDPVYQDLASAFYEHDQHLKKKDIDTYFEHAIIMT
jgi:hypothetical protein